MDDCIFNHQYSGTVLVSEEVPVRTHSEYHGAAAVQADLDQAKASKEEAHQLRQQYEDTLSGAKQEASTIIANARTAAKEQGNQITEQAQQEASRMIQNAQKEIADLALAAAAKLVEGKMDDAENRNLVDAFLKEEGVNS